MGMNIKRSRTLIFISTALLTGTVTAFCGPVGFIGLAVPHVTRLLFNNADHRILVPRHYADGTYQHASLRHHRQEIPASGELYHRLARCSGHFMGNS